MNGTEHTGNAVQTPLGHFKASTGADVQAVASARSLTSGCSTQQTELANVAIEGATSFRSLKILADRMLPADHPNPVYIARFLG